MRLIDSAGKLRPVIKILTDYPRDDLAHDEVHQALVTACARHGVDPFNLDVGAVPGMDTVVAGFKAAQLSLNSSLGFGHVFHTNCAPRKNIVSTHSRGEKVVLGMTPSGVALLMVNAGYALAPFHDLAAAGDVVFYQTSVPDSGSQFRSRDYFPDATAELAAHLSAQAETLGKTKIRKLLAARDYAALFKGLPWLGKALKPATLPHLPPGAVMYVDNFGNIKLNFRHSDLLKHYKRGTTLVVRLGHSVCNAVLGDTGFSQGEGMIALTAGSSGWQSGKNRKDCFTEVFLRGGRADRQFHEFAPGEPATVVRKDDLKKVIDILRNADRKTAARIDLYNISEVKIIAMLSRARLITDGYDTTALQRALSKGTLLRYLKD